MIRQRLALAGFLTIAFARLTLYRAGDLVRPRSPAQARATLQWWARWACRRWRLHVEVTGSIPAGHCVYVSNHRSYLDIPVLAGVLPAAFLSRADVARWPLIGPIARLTGAVLVERDNDLDRQRAARTLLARLPAESVIVFPEATTTGARLPAPFRSGIFRLVQRRPVPIVPVTLRYSDRRAYWVDDISVGDHLLSRVLSGPPLVVRVHLGAPLRALELPETDALAAATYAAVCAPIHTQGELA